MKHTRPLLVLLALFAVTSIASAKTPRPNLLLIVADDCTFTDTSVYGGQAHTPTLERLAAEGMRFTRCFQSAPMCSPTRHALYTALHPVKSGAYPNHTFLQPGIESVAHWLRAAGYRAGFSGKTHIDPPEAFPFEYLSERIKNTNPDFKSVDRFLGECRNSATPFGLILCSNEPHTPWTKGDPSQYPVDQLKLPPVVHDTPALRENFSKYLAEITYFDTQVAQALALLDRHGLADNTVVIVVTEQGNAFPFAKWTCYDAGVGSGLLVRWPGRVPAGRVSDALVEYIDLLPTFLAAAGLPVPAGLDGRSFLPVLVDGATRHKDYTFSLQTSRGIGGGPDYFGIRSVRDERYRYIVNLSPKAEFRNWTTAQSWFKEWQQLGAQGDARAAALVHRYIHRPAEELYDSTTDPWNLHNLATAPNLAEVKTRLSTALADWMKDQGDTGQPTELAARSRLWREAELD